MKSMKRDFSIREEIKVELEENLSELNLDIDDIFDSVENDEYMLDVITLSIYKAIREKLDEQGVENDNVENKINQLEFYIGCYKNTTV